VVIAVEDSVGLAMHALDEHDRACERRAAARARVVGIRSHQRPGPRATPRERGAVRRRVASALALARRFQATPYLPAQSRQPSRPATQPRSPLRRWSRPRHSAESRPRRPKTAAGKQQATLAIVAPGHVELERYPDPGTTDPAAISQSPVASATIHGHCRLVACRNTLIHKRTLLRSLDGGCASTDASACSSPRISSAKASATAPLPLAHCDGARARVAGRLFVVGRDGAGEPGRVAGSASIIKCASRASGGLEARPALGSPPGASDAWPFVGSEWPVRAA
jgi:hypothetical protein